MTEASAKHLAGERYSWFVGTMNPDYSFDASCCSDMKVITFQPQQPSGSELMIMRGSGLYQEPMFLSAFYADLAAKTLAAVAKLKKGKFVGWQAGVRGVLTAMFRRWLARDDLHQV